MYARHSWFCRRAYTVHTLHTCDKNVVSEKCLCSSIGQGDDWIWLIGFFAVIKRILNCILLFLFGVILLVFFFQVCSIHTHTHYYYCYCYYLCKDYLSKWNGNKQINTHTAYIATTNLSSDKSIRILNENVNGIHVATKEERRQDV